jgi:hypothetical protein
MGNDWVLILTGIFALVGLIGGVGLAYGIRHSGEPQWQAVIAAVGIGLVFTLASFEFVTLQSVRVDNTLVILAYYLVPALLHIAATVATSVLLNRRNPVYGYWLG